MTSGGQIVGTRSDLQESLAFAALDDVKATISSARLNDVNDVFRRLREGKVEGRLVMNVAH